MSNEPTVLRLYKVRNWIFRSPHIMTRPIPYD